MWFFAPYHSMWVSGTTNSRKCFERGSPGKASVFCERACVPVVTRREQMENACPHCGAKTAENRQYCPNCGRLAIDYLLCEKCCEPVSKKATICPHCSSSIKRPNLAAAESLDLEVTATRLGALFTGRGRLTGLFLPPKIKIQGGRITVTKWEFFGLRCHHQEIQVSKVASVRYTKGVFWGGILVETYGGASEDFCESGLQQEDARTMAKQLKNCLAD